MGGSAFRSDIVSEVVMISPLRSVVCCCEDGSSHDSRVGSCVWSSFVRGGNGKRKAGRELMVRLMRDT